MTIASAVSRAAPAWPGYQPPWSPRAWGKALSVAGGAPAQCAALGLVALVTVALLASVLRFRDWWPGPAGAALLAVLAALALLAPELTRMHRHRLRAATGTEIASLPAIPDRLTWHGAAALLRAQATWRQLGYHVIAGPALGLAALAATGAWVFGLLGAAVYAYGRPLDACRWPRQATFPSPYCRPLSLGGVPDGIFWTAGGIALLLAAPWLTACVAALDARVAAALLGPSRAEELAMRVAQLARDRAGVVDAADAERRRMERDLHDGTQQRLVSLAMNLGMARASAMTAQEAREAITVAHEEAKAALSELRDLIRGYHPAVLEDRGLDAALSGIAARMAVPVRLSVDLPRRPAPVIEAVAYFVVSEGLANVAKHARASQAEVVVAQAGDRLHVIISDDGAGGADPARGTGLAGLARRVASVDGTFEIASPPGGPTLVTVDLPCAR